MLLKINPNKIDFKKIRIAAKIIKQGGIVAFPTETVYGLGVDALNPKSCKKLFEIKQRPLNDPLIVHIYNTKDLFRLTKYVPLLAIKLVNKFWPGPLTLVLKKSDIVPDIVTAGLDTVAIRMPKNSVALNLIKESGTPIAAPSANLFGELSPTNAQDVIDSFKNRIDVVIDTGKTEIGVESTVIDLTQKPYKVLRPGGVTVEQLKKVIKQIKVNTDTKKIVSPGMFHRHYAPKSKVILVKRESNQIQKMRDLVLKYKKIGKKVGVIITEKNKNKFIGFNTKVLGPDTNYKRCAVNLYDTLRNFDKIKMDVIVVEGLNNKGFGLAIMDRLNKASDKMGEKR